MAATLKRGSQTVSPQVLGPLGVRGEQSTVFQPRLCFTSPTVLSFSECS